MSQPRFLADNERNGPARSSSCRFDTSVDVQEHQMLVRTVNSRQTLVSKASGRMPSLRLKYRRWGSNPHGRYRPEDFKSSASALTVALG